MGLFKPHLSSTHGIKYISFILYESEVIMQIEISEVKIIAFTYIHRE